MIKCHMCHTQNRDDALFCRYCSVKLNQPEKIPAAVAGVTDTPSPKPTRDQIDRSMVGIMALVVLFIVVCIYLSVTAQHDTSEPEYGGYSTQPVPEGKQLCGSCGGTGKCTPRALGECPYCKGTGLEEAVVTEGDPQTIETDCVFVFSDRQGAHALQVGPPGDSELMMCSPEDAETVRTLVKSLDLAQITYQRYSDGQAKVLSVEIVPRQ